MIACIGLAPRLAQAMPQDFSPNNGLGYCYLTVTSSIVKTSTCSINGKTGIPSGAIWALVCNEGTAARWADDGFTVITASNGQILPSGTATSPTCQNFFDNFQNLQWIAESGTATLDITFYQ